MASFTTTSFINFGPLSSYYSPVTSNPSIKGKVYIGTFGRDSGSLPVFSSIGGVTLVSYRPGDIFGSPSVLLLAGGGSFICVFNVSRRPSINMTSRLRMYTDI